jgi:hypothetical protein
MVRSAASSIWRAKLTKKSQKKQQLQQKYKKREPTSLPILPYLNII